MITAIYDAFNNERLCQTFLPVLDQDLQDCIDKWGCKWDVGASTGGATISDNGNIIDLSFDSAWTPPIAFYDELVRLGCSVSASYFEPGCCFVGEYINGEDDCYSYSPDQMAGQVPAYLIDNYDIKSWYELD